MAATPNYPFFLAMCFYNSKKYISEKIWQKPWYIRVYMFMRLNVGPTPFHLDTKSNYTKDLTLDVKFGEQLGK